MKISAELNVTVQVDIEPAGSGRFEATETITVCDPNGVQRSSFSFRTGKGSYQMDRYTLECLGESVLRFAESKLPR